MHQCTNAPMHIYTYTYTRIHAYTHTRIHASTHTRIHAYTHIRIYRIYSNERPGRSFKSRYSRGGAHSRGGGGSSFKNQRFREVEGSFDRETAVILEAELKKRKELFSHFDFTVENIPIARFPAALSKKYGS